MPRLKPGTKTLAELKKEATGLQIKGRSKMNKKQLMSAVGEAKDIESEITKDVPKDVFEIRERVKRDESPTRIDKAKMKELKKTSRDRLKTPKLSEVKQKPAPKPVKDAMRDESPTRIDKEKMKELKKTGRKKPGRGKYAVYEKSPASRGRYGI